MTTDSLQSEGRAV